MSFYPQYPPAAFYAYPMPYPSQDFYAMYPPTAMDPNAQIYYEPNNNMNVNSPYNNNNQFKFRNDKPGYNNRKDSQDSGISDYMSSRKTSNSSTISNASIMEEPTLENVNEDEIPFEPPNDELCVQIVQQVEFYFSDANITKDKFLLKHVKRNKDGFVSLKLVSSFKRVKHLTKDWRQVANAVERKSKKLEVNDLKTKVRRLEALPEYDETTPSRTVVALNLPLERPTIESVAELFSVCGEIVLVRILRPGNPVPADVRPFVNKHPEMTTKVCALIEFDRTEFAMKAVQKFNEEEEDKMKVMELTAPPPAKTSKKSEEKRKLSLTSRPPPSNGLAQQPQRRYSQGSAPPQMQMNNDSSQALAQRRKISLFHNMKFAPILEEQHKAASLNPNAPIFNMQQRRLSRPSPPPGMATGGLMMDPSTGILHSVQPIPAWMSRRISGQLEYASSGLTLPPNVVRQPRGPDKSQGFQNWCRSRMEPAPARRLSSKAVPIVAPPKSEGEAASPPKAESPEPEVSNPLEGANAHPMVDIPLSSSEDDEDYENGEHNIYSSEDDEGHFSDQEPRFQPVMLMENERSR